MIAIIADDFTGAAEIAGIVLQYNLSAIICTNQIVYTNEDVLIVSSDSRSLSKNEAIAITNTIVSDLLKLQPTFIYKKVDSVLRGHVLDELKVQMELTGLKKALLLPANPSLGRIIIDQKYYINEQPIHHTSFFNDPEFPIHDASIDKLLKVNEDDSVYTLKSNQDLPSKGIIVGEVASTLDFNHWIKQLDDSYLLAGAGDFFESLLNTKFKKMDVDGSSNSNKNLLYVSGTSFQKSESLIQQIQQETNCVHYLSTDLMNDKQDLNWFKEVSNTILSQGRLVIAIDDTKKQGSESSALSLRMAMAKAVKKVIQKEGFQELFIEGGSTAAAIFSELGISNFIPQYQYARGVLKMKASEIDLYITVKPGSYVLPKEIKNLYLK
jgi:D-threonate/D-erythronate kinase